MIGIIFIGNLKYCPYLERYKEILDRNNIEYEVLYWNREASSKEYPDNYIEYKKKSKLNKNSYLKLFDFIRYKLWLNRVLKIKKYDKLIILSTLSGIINYKILTKMYKGKYIFDIRDYSYENNTIFYALEKEIIKSSKFTCISSEGFKNFLPKQFDYLSVHNFNHNDISLTHDFTKKTKEQTLNFVWMGAVRYFNHQKKIIDKLKNDSRFNIIYHGSGAELEEYKIYCKQNKINNITFTGEYDNDKKYELLKNVDIINNSYMSPKIMEVKYAISNKFYDGLIYKIPQLVEPNTFKHSKVMEKGIGIAIDPEDEFFADKLFRYYHGINEVEFKTNCSNELNNILEDDQHYINQILSFIGIN